MLQSKITGGHKHVTIINIFFKVNYFSILEIVINKFQKAYFSLYITIDLKQTTVGLF